MASLTCGKESVLVCFFLSMHITPRMDRRCIVTVRDELKMAQVDSD